MWELTRLTQGFPLINHFMLGSGVSLSLSCAPEAAGLGKLMLGRAGTPQCSHRGSL